MFLKMHVFNWNVYDELFNAPLFWIKMSSGKFTNLNDDITFHVIL